MKTQKEISEMIKERVEIINIITLELNRINEVSENKTEFVLGSTIPCQVQEIKELFKDGTWKAHKRINRLKIEINLLNSIIS